MRSDPETLLRAARVSAPRGAWVADHMFAAPRSPLFCLCVCVCVRAAVRRAIQELQALEDVRHARVRIRSAPSIAAACPLPPPIFQLPSVIPSRETSPLSSSQLRSQLRSQLIPYPHLVPRMLPIHILVFLLRGLAGRR